MRFDLIQAWSSSSSSADTSKQLVLSQKKQIIYDQWIMEQCSQLLLTRQDKEKPLRPFQAPLALPHPPTGSVFVLWIDRHSSGRSRFRTGATVFLAIFSLNELCCGRMQRSGGETPQQRAREFIQSALMGLSDSLVAPESCFLQTCRSVEAIFLSFLPALHHYVHCYEGRFYHAGASRCSSPDWSPLRELLWLQNNRKWAGGLTGSHVAPLINIWDLLM